MKNRNWIIYLSKLFYVLAGMSLFASLDAFLHDIHYAEGIATAILFIVLIYCGHRIMCAWRTINCVS